MKKDNDAAGKNTIITIPSISSQARVPQAPSSSRHASRQPLGNLSNFPTALPSAHPAEEGKAATSAKRKSYAMHKQDTKESRVKGCIRVFPIGDRNSSPSMIKAYYKCSTKDFNKKKMDKVTAVVYDDFHQDIYIGNEAGGVLKWSSKF